MKYELLIEKIFRRLPFFFAAQAARIQIVSGIRKTARKSLSHRTVTIYSGAGKGLKFNSGASNPDSATGLYELPVQRVLADYLRNDDVFYDIGANIGFFSCIGARLVGESGHVYAFEPVVKNVNAIRRNVKLNRFDNVTIIEKAVGRSNGKAQLLLTKNTGGHTLASAGAPHNVIDTQTVGVVSVDSLVSTKAIEPPSVVKIDVEGAEVDVLSGMANTIKIYRPIIIYEIDDEDIHAYKQKQENIELHLKRYEYRIEPLEESYPGIRCKVGHAVGFPII